MLFYVIINYMEHKIIFGVCGTQNVGKTTFINDVVAMSNVRIDKNLHYVVSSVDYRKKIEAEGLQINRNGNLKSQQIIFETLCENILAAYKSNSKRIILDRLPIDAFVYTLWHYKYNKNSDVTVEALEYMYTKMVQIMALVDCVIYIPLSECNNVAVVDDKFRDTDLTYRKQIDSLMSSTISSLSLSKMFTISGDRDTRVLNFNALEFTINNDIIKSSVIETIKELIANVE